MRRPTSVLTTAIFAIALMVPDLPAQQLPPTGDSPAAGAPPAVSSTMLARGARYLLRNGWDYIDYQEYERALGFFREAEIRKAELSKDEIKRLYQGIAKAQDGMRDPSNANTRAYAKSGKRRPGALAYAGPSAPANLPGQAPALATQQPPVLTPAPDSIQLASNSTTMPPTRAATPIPAPAPVPNQAPMLAPQMPAMTSAPVQANPADVTLPAAAPQVPTAPPATTAVTDTPSPLPASPTESTAPAVLPAPELPPSPPLAKIGADKAAPHPILLEVSAQPQVVPAQPPAMAAVPAPTPTAALSPAPAPTRALAMAPAPATATAWDRAPQATPPAAETPVSAPALAPLAVIDPVVLRSSKGEANAAQPDPGTQPTQPAELAPQPAPSAPGPVTIPASPSRMPVDMELPPLPEVPSQPPVPPVIPPTAEYPTTAAPATTPSPGPDSLPPLPAELANAPVEPSPSVTPSLTPEPVTTTNTIPLTNTVPTPEPVTTSNTMPVLAPERSPDPVPVPVTNSALEETVPPAVAGAGRASLPDSPPPARPASLPDRTSPPPVQIPYQERPTVTATPRPVNDGAPRIAAASVRPPADSLLPTPPEAGPVSTLSPELRRQVEMIAQREEELLQRAGPPNGPPPGNQPTANTSAPSTRLEISRAPSPTEARPIRAIPVPEEFVPLSPRDWSPNRKYFAAAATCHMPLYFQDASLERYGHNTEQFFGPLGRFMTYPVDDPSQSNQRNQIMQPFFSIGLFAAQIALLPYNMIVDPPWEAEYDLGYYRPGDLIPTDMYYLPYHGVGPPLRGKRY